MKNSGNNVIRQFGAYDFFGYLGPGAAFLLCVAAFEYWCLKYMPTAPLAPALASLKLIFEGAKAHGVIFSSLVVACLVLAAYLAGHVVSSLSSFFIDRIYVAKAIGYPYETLLKLTPKSGERRMDSRGFYRGLFFWLNTYLVFRLLAYFFVTHSVSVFSAAFFNNGLLVAEIAIALAVILKVGQSTFRNQPRLKPLRQWRVAEWSAQFARWYLSCLFPVLFNFFNNMVEAHSRTTYPFDQEFRTAYQREFENAFKIDASKAGTDNFWYCKMYIATEAPHFDKSLNYWMYLYSFSRNLSTAFYAAFFYAQAFTYLQYESVERGILDGVGFISTLPFAYLALSIALLARFKYIYFGYFNRFLFRAFLYCRSDVYRNRPSGPGETS